tara:strand:- start:970 stop:1122 length:153 start_codon:yes stop_codon:yes gene_type:complete
MTYRKTLYKLELFDDDLIFPPIPKIKKPKPINGVEREREFEKKKKTKNKK